MLYLISQLWIFVVPAFLLGFWLGWRTTEALAKRQKAPVVSHDGRATGLERLILLFGGIFVAGILVAILEILGGVIGLWWDVSMLLIAAFVLGCVLGSLARRWPLPLGIRRATLAAAPLMPEIPVPDQPVAAEQALPTMLPDPAEVARPQRPATPVAPLAARLVISSPFPTAPMLWAAPTGESERGIAPPQPILAEPQPLLSAPQPAPSGTEEQKSPSARPPALPAPNADRKDDLQRIRGIGPVGERKLNELGIYHYAQIAAWQPEQAEWINAQLGFSGRIQRENWIGQAKELATSAEKRTKKRARSKNQTPDQA